MTKDSCVDLESPPRFKRIEVKGLHGRLDFSVDLHPHLNILYGKNGLGKTTFLHIIANLLELDFRRFNYLKFGEVIARTDRGDGICIRRSKDGMSVLLNDEPISFIDDANGISDSDTARLREAVGNRPAYLPAFRSILERVRDMRTIGYQERNNPELEKLTEVERRAILECADKSDFYPRSNRDLERAHATASKTLQCRQWFGDFVPAVRYPSVTEVTDGLSDEWRTAQLHINRAEQSLFEGGFLEIFEAISVKAEEEQTPQKDILASIYELLSDESSDAIGPSRSRSYERLVQAAGRQSEADAAYNKLLEIYRRVLSERKNVRDDALRPLSEYESSVNKFLDQKKLKIGYIESSKQTVRARASFVNVVPTGGRPYGLTALSSGERQIATMLYSASRSVVPVGAFLIDEPELSLHVDWQRIILLEIQKLHPGRQIIACTHSPEVGADHAEYVKFFEPSLHVSADSEMEDDRIAGEEEL